MCIRSEHPVIAQIRAPTLQHTDLGITTRHFDPSLNRKVRAIQLHTISLCSHI